MNYFKEGAEYQAVENKVARVFGGNVELEGGYLTDEISENANPIQVRNELALSQTEFYGDDGELKRNMASGVVRGTIYTTEDNEIIDLNGELTGEYLEWGTVKPEGELEGGANEHKLKVPFDSVVEIKSVEDLIHHSTPGWDAYVEVEKEIQEAAQESMAEEPVDIWEEPVEVYEEPVEVYEEPVDIWEEPVEVYEEPVEVYEEPVDIWEEPVDVRDDVRDPEESL